MPNTVATQTPNKCGHHTVHPFPGSVNAPRICSPPLASLWDAGEDDPHPGKATVEVLQVLLHRGDKVHSCDGAEVIAAAVDEQDIRGCSSSQGLEKEGDEVPPSQAPPAKPPDPRLNAEVPSPCVPGSLLSTSDVAVPNDPNSFT